MNSRPKQRRRRAGSALIIVLAMVTIVTVLVLVYFGTVGLERSATQSYSQRMSADQIALGGLDRLKQDLRQEIQAGSTATANAAAGSPVYYKPVAPQSMIPARYSTATVLFTNLVRTSSSSHYAAAYPAAAYPDPAKLPANLAAASSTAAKALDGSYTSLKRWEKPQLLLPGEAMPAPDWILMTRNGPTSAAGLGFGGTGNTLNNRDVSNPNFVNGRYAYAIYNEGGLLDATVAGAPGAAGADDVANRGSLALAPLTNGVFTPAQAAALTAWRNAASGQSQLAVTNYVYTLSATNGFLHVQPGDATFLSRQDLIAYAAYAGIGSALPYLGTFNRAVNAPNYIPAAVTAQNPDLLTLRVSADATINSGGTLLKSHDVKAGDFLLSRRFPLGRLSWVGYDGPANGASATDVWRAFGLVWDNPTKAWVYASGAGATLPAATAIKTAVKTLAQVAQENPPRDPDFFELLQAGIVQGSLGQTGGRQTSVSGASLYLYGGTGDTFGYDSSIAYHLMQIGVNIIDQARADSFPTAIRLGTDPVDLPVDAQHSGVSKTPSTLPVRTFYGVKNLPYIHRVIDTFARWVTPPAPLDNNDSVVPGHRYTQPYVGCWLQFELWNPHQVTATTPGTTAALYPAALRIIATGRLHGYVYSRQPGATDLSGEYTSKPGGSLNSPNGTQTQWTTTATAPSIQLTTAALSAFSEPKLVSSTDVATASASCLQDGTATTGSGLGGAGGTAFAGLYVGSAFAPDWCYSGNHPGTSYGSATSPPADPVCLTYNLGRINPYVDTATYLDPGVTYAMQYQVASDPAGTWRTYGLVKNLTLTGGTSMPASTQTESTWTLQNSNANARFIQKIDPRTDRFSVSQNSADQTGTDAAAVSSGDTIRPSAATSGHSSDTCLPYGASWLGKTAADRPPIPNGVPADHYYLGGIMENTTSSSIYYKDPDGTLRRGDSAYDTAAAQDGHPGIANASFTGGFNLARPVFLNRPFRSVGELGYAGRDLPWKTLDFFTKESGDAGLLDLFSVSDADVVAGTIDLNTRNAKALAEALGGAAINPDHVGDAVALPLAPAQAAALANALIAATTASPLRSRSQLVTDALDPGTGETALSVVGYNGQSSKVQREAAIRALSESGNARTWNLLIDIVAQSGRYPQTLAAGASLDSFLPDGEKRYWLHVAIDRYTGKVVDSFLESVRE